MARTNGSFTGNLLIVAQKAFVSGCFGCLGAGMAFLVVFVIVFGVFPAQFAAVIKTLPVSPLAFVSPAAPTPTGALPAIEVFVTTDGQPSSTHVTQVRVPVKQSLFICVQNPKGTEAHLAVRITLPTGQVVPFEGDFTTDPDGKPFCIGEWTDFPNIPGVYRIDVVIGPTIVGSTVITAVT